MQYFKALSDTTRIRLLNILLHHELSVNEIVSLMGMGQSRISRHLKIMTDAGFLVCRRDGVWAFYFVADKGPGRRFIDSIRYLLNHDPIMIQDLERASQIVKDRSLKTMLFFNNIAGEWDLLRKEILGDFDLNAAILEQVEPCSVSVDLGCGTGELLSSLKSVSDVVIGVDSSAKMLEEARKRFQKDNGKIEFRLGELEHLPLSDGEADSAVISMVLHHISNPDAVIAEVYRILRPGGRFIIADFEKHKNETMRETYGDRWLGFAQDEISSLLSNHNFVLSESKVYGVKKDLILNIYQSIKN